MSLSGKLVCFTGTLATKRADAKKQAEAAGATVGSSVTGKTDILIAGPGAGSKMAEAAAKGVEVWSEQDFLDALKAGGKAGGKAKATGKTKAAAAPDPPASKKAKVSTTLPSPTKTVASTLVTSTTDGDAADVDPDALKALGDSGVTVSTVKVLAHYKLVEIDISTNTDKYYVMQHLTGGVDQHFVFTRWGRTGTKGQVKIEGPWMSPDESAANLAKKFKDKTGNSIESASDGTFTHKAKKYDLVKGDTGAAVSVVGKDGGCLWQYYVNDGVDGKPNGWYDYMTEAAEVVESVYAEWQKNKGLDVRCVQSGAWCYKVDFNDMQQTNVGHPGRKQRAIRRNP